MASSFYSIKHLTLDEVKKVIDSFGGFAENILCTHSLGLVISNSGEATFTSSGWKLLNEAGFICPLGRIISNAAKNYTSLCGDDCKYFLFILKEVFSVIYNKVNGNNEAYMRRQIINEISSLKHILPCLFRGIQNMSDDHIFDLDLLSFTKDLHSIVLTFMLSRFSISVSKILSSLISDFIENISCESSSLKIVLDYVISHFDIFCCKVLSLLSESRVLKGFLFYRKHIPSDLNLENVNFIIVSDLSMKILMKEVTWEIKDESFMTQLNPLHFYQKVFEYFKSQNIMLLLTPSTSDKDVKLLCEKNNIFLFDQLEREEINHMLSCFHLYPLENLNEAVESKHIGKLSCVKSFFHNKSHFLHLRCTNSVRLLNAHHILLSAPCNAIWTEYYSECLNCFRMVRQWLSTKTNSCSRKKIIHKVPEENQKKFTQLLTHEESEDCDICPKLKIKFENEASGVMHLDVIKSYENNGIVLPPGLWELIFKSFLGKISEDISLPCSVVLQAMHIAIGKSICKRIGIPFVAVKDIENIFTDFIKKCKQDDVHFLEPVVCKEIMIYNILDLILQLLKIDSIVFMK